jgi:Sensors of blue-light using FAD
VSAFVWEGEIPKFGGPGILQVLEGVPDAVEAIYVKIELDKRHDQVTKIVAEAVPSRSFANWTMGFSQVSRKELALISGTNDFFSGSSCFLSLDSGRAKKLLSAFREGRWRKTLTPEDREARRSLNSTPVPKDENAPDKGPVQRESGS